MMRRATIVLAVLVLLGIAVHGQAASRRRVALIIGNSAYKPDALPTARAGAEEVSKKLRALGIGKNDLIECPDCTHAEMIDAIDKLRARLQIADEAIFYYAGHGAEIGSKNYMVPIDVTKENLASSIVSVDNVYEAMRLGSSRFNLVILDACRNNPFIDGGAGKMIEPEYQEIPVGTVIAFSTRPGSLASDGIGVYSWYTEALLEFMKGRGMTIQEFFMRVRNKVQDLSSQGQTPWETTSQTVDFSFSAPAELEITMIRGDDEVIVMTNGQGLLWSHDGRVPRPSRLKTGDNIVNVFVHNDKTLEGGGIAGFGKKEGWNFDVELRVRPEDERPSPKMPNISRCSAGKSVKTPTTFLCGEEETPELERWGTTFLAAAVRVNVSEHGDITFPVIENEVWRDAFSVADNSERDALDLSLAWPFWHEPREIYDGSYPGKIKPLDDIVAEAIAAHRAKTGGLTVADMGSSAQAHLDAIARIEKAMKTDRRLVEEALMRMWHWELERQAHGVIANLQWVVQDSRESFKNDVSQRNFESLRGKFREKQGHNPNAVNVLGLLSNGQIETIVMTPPP